MYEEYTYDQFCEEDESYGHGSEPTVTNVINIYVQVWQNVENRTVSVLKLRGTSTELRVPKAFGPVKAIVFKTSNSGAKWAELSYLDDGSVTMNRFANFVNAGTKTLQNGETRQWNGFWAASGKLAVNADGSAKMHTDPEGRKVQTMNYDAFRTNTQGYFLGDAIASQLATLAKAAWSIISK